MRRVTKISPGRRVFVRVPTHEEWVRTPDPPRTFTARGLIGTSVGHDANDTVLTQSMSDGIDGDEVIIGISNLLVLKPRFDCCRARVQEAMAKA